MEVNYLVDEFLNLSIVKNFNIAEYTVNKIFTKEDMVYILTSEIGWESDKYDEDYFLNLPSFKSIVPKFSRGKQNLWFVDDLFTKNFPYDTISEDEFKKLIKDFVKIPTEDVRIGSNKILVKNYDKYAELMHEDWKLNEISYIDFSKKEMYLVSTDESTF